MAILEGEEYFKAFVDEAKELMSVIEENFLILEEQGEKADKEVIDKIYRSVHSIKGSASFLSLNNIKNLSHSIENILNKIRNKEIPPKSDVISVLLESIDILSNLIDNVKDSDNKDISEILVSLQGAFSAYTKDSQEKSVKEDKENIKEDIKDKEDKKIDIFLPNNKAIFSLSDKRLKEILKDKFLYILEYELSNFPNKDPLNIIKELYVVGSVIATKIESTITEEGENQPFYVLLSTNKINLLNKVKLKRLYRVNKDGKSELIKEDTISKILSSKKDKEDILPFIKESRFLSTRRFLKISLKNQPKKFPRHRISSSTSQNTIRVDLKILDNLMEIGGELVLNRNQLIQCIRDLKEDESSNIYKRIKKIGQCINLLTSELQENIMTMRMQPIGNLFKKFKRLIRDMAKELGKDVVLFIEGEDVEVDKAIIEAISDPLNHLIRNAIDHGIEFPEERIKKGKKGTGVLILSAFHEAGQVIIEVTDDGAGIDVEKIKKKALANGLYDLNTLEKMSDKELLRLIFHPGFSLAKKVSEISGRGVGMDIVRANIMKLGGVVDIDTQVGYGTTVRMSFPLTLVIMTAQIIEVKGLLFAIPQLNIQEIVRVKPSLIKKRIEKIGKTLVLRLREELIPLIILKEVLKIEKKVDISTNKGALNIIVVKVGDIKYGIIIDKFLDLEDIVIKPLGRYLRKCKCYSGTTVLGNGKLALILDIMGLAEVSNLTFEEDLNKLEKLDTKILDKNIITRVLLFKSSKDETFAVELDNIIRIEKIKKSEIEYLCGLKVFNYNNSENVPIFYVDDIAYVSICEDKEELYVIIFSLPNQKVGILCSEILDIVEVDLKIDTTTFRQRGIKGSFVFNKRNVLYVDIFEIVKYGMPKWDKEKVKNKTILVIEDSVFFLKKLKNILEREGFIPICAENGKIALDILKKDKEIIGLILTDIEMPVMDGITFASKVKEIIKRDIPIIALTSLADESIKKKAREVGIKEYLIKFDKDELLKIVKRYLRNG